MQIGNTDSDLLPLTCGLPQGSNLSPLLFLLYINDMPNCSSKLSFRLFADDSNIFYSSNNLKDITQTMNTEFDNILYYCSANKLSINIKKTNFMIISSPNKRVSSIYDIEQKDFIKYLGIYIDKHLKWEQQIKHVKSKISKNTGIINKLRFYVDLNTLKQLYYTLIYPYISYGLISWGNTYTTHLNKICTAQNKCVKNILFAHKRENATVYFNLLGILTIENAFKLKVAIFTSKIINDQICPVFANS